MARISGDIYTEGFVELQKDLDKLLLSNPEMEKKVQDIVRKVLVQVRANMTQEARSAMQDDPRKANRAVRSMVYRQILGGQVNILNKKKAGAAGDYEPTRTLRTGQRGGNRRPRSERTKRLQGYMGSDRGFVLRFINAGTASRTTKYGSRGAIAGNNWFGRRSQQAMENAANALAYFIDNLIKEEFEKA